MKLAQQRFDVETNLQSTDFQFGNSAKMFAILADKIYSDKPRAVVREYASNCLDIHIRTGQVDPFVVSLPNDLDPSITFRDKGTGLSDELVRTLFCTFFASDKQATNNELGGFGLGSKAGFAYTDAFTITSYQGGVKHLYAAFRGEDGVPKISAAGQEPTDEPDGLEVKIPVRREDWDKFETITRDVLRWFPAGSFQVYGAKTEILAVQPEVRYPTWMTVKPDGYTYVLMGAVAYRVDWGIMGLEMPPGIVPIFKIGELDLPPSREQLSYDNTTIARLKARHSEICQQYVPRVLRDAMTMQPVERLKFANELKQSALGKIFRAYHKERGNYAKDAAAKKSEMRRLGKTYLDEDKFQPKWGDCLLWEHENIVIPAKARRIEVRQKRGSYRYTADVRGARSMDLIRLHEITQILRSRFIFNDMEHPTRLEDRLNEAPHSNFIYLVQPSGKVPNLDALKALLPDADHERFHNLSEFELPKRERKKREHFETLLPRSRFGHTSFESEYGQVPDYGTYVTFTGHAMDEQFLELMQVEWAKHETVYGFTKKVMSKIDLDDFQRLDVYLKEKVSLSLADPVVLSALSADWVLEKATLSPLWDFVETRADNGGNGLLDPQVQAVRALLLDKQAVPASTIKSLHQMAALGLAKLPKPKDFHNVVKLLERAEKKNSTLIYVLTLAHCHNYLDLTGPQDELLKGIAR